MFKLLKQLIDEHSKNLLIYVKRDKELCKWLISMTPMLDNSYTLLTRIFWVLNDITSFPVCEKCGKPVVKNIT